MDKLKSFFNGEEDNAEEQNGIIAQSDVDFVVSDSMKLSKTTRIKGFIICFVIGILLSILGSFALFLSGGLTVYGVFYTLGNILSLASTCFLMGPVNQLKKMFAPTRVIATIMIFVAFGLTLFAALSLHNAGLALLFIIIQSFAMLWYSLSYIPYARDAVKKTVEACIANLLMDKCWLPLVNVSYISVPIGEEDRFTRSDVGITRDVKTMFASGDNKLHRILTAVTTDYVNYHSLIRMLELEDDVNADQETEQCSYISQRLSLNNS